MKVASIFDGRDQAIHAGYLFGFGKTGRLKEMKKSDFPAHCMMPACKPSLQHRTAC